MAELKNNILGNISGKLGKVVYRNMNGKTFVQIRPEKYNFSKSKEAVNGRNNFSAAVMLAKELNKNSLIKFIWKGSKIVGSSPYHKILRTNIPLCENGTLTLNNIIVPQSGNEIKQKNPVISILNSKITITLDSIPEKIKNESNELKAFMVLNLINNENQNSLRLYSVDLNKTNYGNKIVFNFNIDNNLELSLFKNIIIYFTIISLNENGEVLNYTDTFSSSFNN